MKVLQGFIHRVGRLVLLDRAADPTAAGEMQRNATHVKAYSGGAVRSLSDILAVATIAQVNAGADNAKTVTPDNLAGSIHGEAVVQMVVTDFATDVPAIGTGKFYLHIDSKLNGMDLVRVHASAITAGVTGTMDIQLTRLSAALLTPVAMLSTKLTIDSAEIGSDTAAIPAVINTLNDDVVTNQWVRVDLDAVQVTKAKGLIVTLVFRLP